MANGLVIQPEATARGEQARPSRYSRGTGTLTGFFADQATLDSITVIEAWSHFRSAKLAEVLAG